MGGEVMPRVTIRDSEFAYKEYGTGFPVIFAHTLFWSGEMWASQVEHFSKKYRCLVPEIWAHGDSGTRLETEISMDQLAKDFWAFMEALEIESCFFVGLSTGGMIGARIAHDHPEAFKGLVVMSSYLGAESVAKQNEYLPMMDAVARAEFFAPELVELIAPYIFGPHTYNTNPDLITRFKRSLTSISFANVPTITAVGKGMYNRPTYLEELRSLTVPTLYMVGEDDMLRPLEETRQMTELTPKARYSVVPRAGHVPCVEQPESVNEELEAFFEEILASGDKKTGLNVA
jgi:pimeloyl-ACP methyl ester carboxylesterase